MRNGWFIGSNGNHFHDWGGFRYCVSEGGIGSGYVVARNGKAVDFVMHQGATLTDALARAEQISGYASAKVRRA